MSKRVRACLIHLVISVALVGGSLLLMLRLWYSDGMLAVVGATQVMVVVLLVDVCLGPLLTLLVYNPEKKELKMDLAVIALLQCAALSYGGWVLADGRPLWVVLHQDYFQLVRQQDLDLRQWVSVAPEYREPHWAGPGWAATNMPVDETADQRDQRIFDELVGGVTPAQKPDLYVPLEQKKAQLLKAAEPVIRLESVNSASDIEFYLTQYPEVDAFVPLRTLGEPLVVLLNTQTGKVATIANLRPW